MMHSGHKVVSKNAIKQSFQFFACCNNFSKLLLAILHAGGWQHCMHASQPSTEVGRPDNMPHSDCVVEK